LDHYAHYFGMDHPEIHKALIDADADIKFMIDTIQSDFILMTFGDHGTRRTDI